MKFKVFLLSLLLPCALLAVAGFVMTDFHQTPDERFTRQRGAFYYHNWNNFNLQTAREQLSDVIINYGPLFDVMVVASASWLEEKRFVTDPVVSHHVSALVSAAIGVWATFMLAYLLLGSVTAALLASLNLFLLPRFFGASTNNLKDIPFCAFFALALLLLVQAERRQSLFWALCAGMMTGASYAVRVAAIFIIPVALPWLLLRAKANKDWAGSGSRLLLCVAAAAVIIPLCWPYYRFEYLERARETLSLFARHPWEGGTLYLGHEYPGRAVPWHYPLTLLGVTTPLYILIFAVLGLIVAWSAPGKRPFSGMQGSGVLLACWLFLPLLAHGLSHSPKYDSVRHYVFVFPALAILSAGAICHFGLRIKALLPPKCFILYLGLISALMALQIQTLKQLHPYQYIYFNELTGGLRGAAGRFALDYWGQSLKEAGEWISANAPRPSRIMVMPGWRRLLKLDPQYFETVAVPFQYPNFTVISRLSNFPEPPPLGDTAPQPKLVYSSGVAGVELLRIYEYPENRQIGEMEVFAAARQTLANRRAGLHLRTFANQFFRGTGKKSIVPRPEIQPLREGESSRRFSGFLHSPVRQTRCFKLASDDGSSFVLDRRLVARADSHKDSRNTLTLESGFHRLTIEHLNSYGRSFLNLSWAVFDADKNACGNFEKVPAELFFHQTLTDEGQPVP